MSGSTDWLEKKLSDVRDSDIYPFHMPGHKRRFVFPKDTVSSDADHGAEEWTSSDTDHGAEEWTSSDAVRGPEVGDVLRAAAGLDITEVSGFDDLHAPEGILKEEMERAAALYGADQTIFSVNGSTGAILAAISAAVPEGGRILAARNCHRSVFHAIYLRRLKAAYVLPAAAPYAGCGARAEKDTESSPGAGTGTPPGADAGWALAGGEIRAEDVAAALREQPGTAAVVITSPTYDGIVSDVRAIARAAHEAGAVLIVDEAHGAHLSMHPYFPESAVRLGADLVIQSMHKTLPALTQTALLHRTGDRVPVSRIRYFMDLYETSSPSYLLMASMTSCIHLLEERKDELFSAYAGRLQALRKILAQLENLTLLTWGGCPERENENRYDPSKLCIGVGTSGLTGPELAAVLRDEWHIETEMCAPDYVLAMTSVSDTEEGFERLCRALSAIDRQCGAGSPVNTADSDSEEESENTAALKDTEGKIRVAPKERSLFGALCGSALPEVRMTIADALEEAMFSEKEVSAGNVLLSGDDIPESGETAHHFIDCYPPGIPLVVPGEAVPEDLRERIRILREKGLSVRIRP